MEHQMDDTDEQYRVIRPRHQERLERRLERESARRRNRILLGALIGVLVLVGIVAALLVGGPSSGDTKLATGDAPADSATVDEPADGTVTPSDGETSTSSEPPATGPTDELDGSVPPAGEPGADQSDTAVEGGTQSVTGPDQPSDGGGATPEPAEPPAASGPQTGTVVRSCGVSGKGDCRIVVRSGPSTKDKAVGRMDEGDTAVFVCTVMGEAVRSTVLDGTTSVWARNESGHYVSMAYLDVPGWDTYETTNPC